MPHSLRVKLKNLQRKGELTDKDIDRIFKALEQDNCPYYVIDEDGHGLCKNHRLEQEPCDDAISRQAVQDYIAKYLSQYLYEDVRQAVEVIDEYIGELPSVNPQEPKTVRGLHLSQQFKDWQFIQGQKADVLDKIRAEIKALSNANPSYWHSGDMVEREEVFDILDKYKTESDHKCHDCKHYTSGEQDGSCDSYICKGYSDWESDNCN